MERKFSSGYLLLQDLIDTVRATDAGPLVKMALAKLDAQAKADDANSQVQDAIATARFASDDEHELDPVPLTSVGDDAGVWVQTWVWTETG